ncbi:hypothetical protein D9619_012803 [Psilocybe cf. subviscida]|uniref:Uncharacterized protein n=1 Tax=Psilocybe cf. subviscida TaxID=2480587 RepID=A0A8H5AQ99_9AGAR|nr:hypothetical protein D9619_012803 [Psilocybe cf. subviscida]
MSETLAIEEAIYSSAILCVCGNMSSNTPTMQHNDANLNPYARVLDAAMQRHSGHARKVVFVKGIFDILLAISVMFFPTFAYNGPVGSTAAKLTGLRNPDWAAEADSAFAIASLIMGAGVAAFTACQSESNCAYRTIAAFNGAFALTGLMTCFFSPHHYGSTFLLLASLQDVFWYTAIVRAGGFGFADCLGVSTRGLYVIEERLSRNAMKAARGVKEELHVIEEHGRETFGGATERTATPSRGMPRRKPKDRLPQHKKGLEQSDLGPPIPSSMN